MPYCATSGSLSLWLPTLSITAGSCSSTRRNGLQLQWRRAGGGTLPLPPPVAAAAAAAAAAAVAGNGGRGLP